MMKQGMRQPIGVSRGHSKMLWRQTGNIELFLGICQWLEMFKTRFSIQTFCCIIIYISKVTTGKKMLHRCVGCSISSSYSLAMAFFSAISLL